MHYYLIVCTACLFGQSRAQCACNDTACRNQAMENNPTTQMCCRWVEQPNDTNPNSLNDPNGTPLGFLLDQYRGTDSNLPDLCVRVNFPTPLKNIRYIVVSVSLVKNLDYMHNIIIIIGQAPTTISTHVLNFNKAM